MLLLLRSDKELNQIVSLKKLAPYREGQGRNTPLRHSNRHNYKCGSASTNFTARTKRKLDVTNEERRKKKQERDLEALNSAVPSKCVKFFDSAPRTHSFIFYVILLGGVDSVRLAAYGFKDGKKKETSADGGHRKTGRIKNRNE